MTTRNLKTGSQVKGTIREVAFGGAGLLKIDGFVLFVPFTAPGDEIVAEITRLKKGYGEAKLIEVVKLSPLRTAPKCPYFEKCMGCQFQHVEYNAQLEIKRKNVEDALRRIGKLEIPEIEVVGSQKEYGYRERITLHLKKGRLGYIEKDNTSLLEIESCPIFCEEKAIFHALKHLFPTSSGRVQVTKSGQGFLVFADVDEFIETEVPPLIKGLHVAYKKNSFKKGTFTQFCEIDGLKIEYTPQTFIQNNFSQSLNIYREICASLYEDNKILDLYSGIGISSLLLQKKGKETLGIELNPFSVKLAKKNSIANGLKPAFKTAKVEDEIGKELSNGYDAILLNPPREGALKEVMDAIRTSKTKKILYVSCMPSTLARDLSIIKSAYKITKVKAFDMFPQTAHIETFVELIAN